jgi:hypothetical protein
MRRLPAFWVVMLAWGAWLAVVFFCLAWLAPWGFA